MIGVFNTITINGTDVYRPNAFTLQREAQLASEYTSCTGKLIGDLIGWKYMDMTLSFETLPQEMMDSLLQTIGEVGEVDMTFSNEHGESVTEKVLIRASNAQVTRMRTYAGTTLWKDFALEITFVNTHLQGETRRTFR